MKLFYYDHCPFCVKARMIFGLKNINIEEQIVMEADIETPTKMIGKKMLPILAKENGSYMGESMDIVTFIDKNYGDKLLDKKPISKIDKLNKELWDAMLGPVIPRFTKANFPELKTKQARDYYTKREELALGDLQGHLNKTTEYLEEIEPILDKLDHELLISHPLNISDIHLYATLRSITLIKGITIPKNVRNYISRMAYLSKVPALYDRAI